MPDFDPFILSRVQFAFTVSFHIVFPAFTIGLASWLAVVEWRWLRAGDRGRAVRLADGVQHAVRHGGRLRVYPAGRAFP